MEAKTDKQQCGGKCWKKIGDLANRIKISSKRVIARGKHRLRQMHLNCCDERELAPNSKISQEEKEIFQKIL